MTGKKNKEYPKRGEVYWVKLDPVVGTETSKIRPGLIVSNDIGNEESNLVMIAPITSKVDRVYPFEVKILFNNKPSKIMLNQCRALDKERLGDKMGVVDHKTMNEVNEAIKVVFSLI